MHLTSYGRTDVPAHTALYSLNLWFCTLAQFCLSLHTQDLKYSHDPMLHLMVSHSCDLSHPLHTHCLAHS